LTGTLSPPFQRLERHVPDERQPLDRRNASPEVAIEGPVVAVQRHDPAHPSASLLPTIHDLLFYRPAQAAAEQQQADRSDPTPGRGRSLPEVDNDVDGGFRPRPDWIIW